MLDLAQHIASQNTSTFEPEKLWITTKLR